MSLLTPSIGECFDRLGIISLKIAGGNGAQHLVAEREQLLLRVYNSGKPLMHRAGSEEKYYPLWLAVQYAVDELVAVNAFIWHKEDRVRELLRARQHQDPHDDEAEAGRLAMGIRRLADRRHELIAEIDRIFGEPRAGKEKSWMHAKATHLPGCGCRGCL